MELAPSDPDGEYARVFVRAWANSFGRPAGPASTAVLHRAYLEQAARRNTWKGPAAFDRWTELATIKRPTDRPAYVFEGQRIRLGEPVTVLLDPVNYIELVPPRPWYRRLLAWLRGK